MSGFVPTCYACGVAGHIRRECPNRAHRAYDGAVQQAQPLKQAQSLLALQAPPSVAQPVQYAQATRNNWYPRLGERVEKIKTILDRLDGRDREQQENEEKAKKQREEEENRAIRRKEWEDLEEAMGTRMEQRFEKMNNTFFEKRQEEEKNELEKLKKKVEELEAALAKSKAAAQQSEENEPVKRYGEEGGRKEGEVLRTPVGVDLRLRGSGCSRQCKEGLKNDFQGNNELLSLKRELDELRREAKTGRCSLERKLEMLAIENQELHRGTERANEEMVTWRNEALRPGNKRGSVAMQGGAVTEGAQTRTRL
ncbi:hypothetical protein CBR_g44367 [Chara braunii]|uniref:CCHC-type domain-containing protein n=1 Tax=Chara braunii TaxID=69332 RepID=A0A388LXC9_CHABU|nr:hypothetical protein CBR_g44367 [Chara braunii]|eukprot:GBG86911.1 hypothetical protein CBR_g44367 [Chara braunii]